MVQVLLPPGARLFGLHVREVTARGGSTVTAAVCEVNPNVAVTVAACELVVVNAVPVKLAVFAPLLTLTDAGTDRAALLLTSPTVTALGAATLKVTVHKVVEPETTVEGEQVTEDSVGIVGTEITPPFPVTNEPLPDASEPRELLIVSDVPPVVVAIVTEMFAITPSAIVVAFNPLSTQVNDPERARHVTVLPAAVAAVPGVAEIATTSAAGYVSVHCRPVNRLPPPDNVKGSESVPPITVEPDERASDGDWPNAAGHRPKLSAIARQTTKSNRDPIGTIGVLRMS